MEFSVKFYSQLFVNFYNNFQWVKGETPFSSPIVPIVAGTIYLITIFGLQAYKKNRKASDVNKWIVLHNAFLIVISAAIFFGTIYEIIKSLTVSDFSKSNVLKHRIASDC